MPGLRFETSREEAAAIERAAIARLLAYARTAKISDPIVRDLIPNEDLLGAGEVGSGNFWQQSLSSLQYHTVYSGTNADDRAFVIIKVGNTKAQPITTAVKFLDGTGRTAIKDIWQVEHAWLNPDHEAYCEVDDAVFYPISKGYNIDFLAKSNGMDNVILGGKVVEPRGKTITPKAAF